MKETRKNLIIISIDNLRADAIGGFGLEKYWQKYNLVDCINTPNLSSLARGGIFFHNCWSTAPYTTNAHASFLTGAWPHQHGLIDFFSAPLKRPTILEIMKKQGYATLWQTDFDFLLGDKLGFGRGIDKFVAGQEKESLAWLEAQTSSFAAFFHFADIHEPYGFGNLSLDFEALAAQIEELQKKYGLTPLTTSYRGESYPMNTKVSDQELLLKQNYRQVLKHLYQEKNYPEIMRLYLAGLVRFDHGRFQNFWQGLKKAGLIENTLVVIIGDHGEAWNENNFGHNKSQGQGALSEELLRVPLIFWSNDVSAKIVEKPVRSIDLVPTLLNYFDIEYLPVSGINLFSEEEISEDLPCFSQYWSVDTALLTIFMNNNLDTEKISQPEFSSCLQSACIRQSGFCLEDIYFKENKKHSILSKQEVPIKNLVNYEAEFLSLSRSLEDYNQKTQAAYDKIKKRLPLTDREEIAAQLRAIGYRV